MANGEWMIDLGRFLFGFIGGSFDLLEKLKKEKKIGTSLNITWKISRLFFNLGKKTPEQPTKN